MPNKNHPILEMRVALTVKDYEKSVKFYCEGLGKLQRPLAPDGMQITLYQVMGKN